MLFQMVFRAGGEKGLLLVFFLFFFVGAHLLPLVYLVGPVLVQLDVKELRERSVAICAGIDVLRTTVLTNTDIRGRIRSINYHRLQHRAQSFLFLFCRKQGCTSCALLS